MNRLLDWVQASIAIAAFLILCVVLMSNVLIVLGVAALLVAPFAIYNTIKDQFVHVTLNKKGE